MSGYTDPLPQAQQIDPIPTAEDQALRDTSRIPEAIEMPFPLVSERNEAALMEFGPKILTDYRNFKSDLLTWLSTFGKKPAKKKGLAETTIKTVHYKLEAAFRWKWREHGTYTRVFTPTDADDFMHLMYHFSEKSDIALIHYERAISNFFTYSNHVENTAYNWKCEHELSQSSGNERKYLKKMYFKPLYEASLSYKGVKSYHNKTMTPEERQRIKVHLASRFRIPTENIGPDEFKRANSWKIPSLVATTLDTGLRPIEVKRARTSWVNLTEASLVIPKEEATKNEEYWDCSLSSTASTALEQWLDEREAYTNYADSDSLWLTEQGNTFRSWSCNHLLQGLMDEATIQFPDGITWYSIRHGVATLWANNVGVHHAKEQLRHKDAKTTLKYLHSDSESRGKVVNGMW